MVKTTDEERLKILHSPFDIETHRETFVNYLEVVIDQDGMVHYAVPSHQMYMLDRLVEKWGITRRQVSDRCPEDRYFDFDCWLMEESGVMLVWTDFYKTVGMNEKQYHTMKRLSESGLFKGTIREAF